MEMMEQNEVRHGIQGFVGERQAANEVTVEFSLPDYQPEIKRLLRVSAVVSPADRYIGAGNAEFSGNIDYNVLYAGNDGGLYCTGQTGDYQFSIPTELPADFDLNQGLTCDVETLPESVTGRLAGPRKLTVRCRLRSKVKMYAERPLEEHLGGANEKSLQRLLGESSAARVWIGTGEEFPLADEILPDGNGGDLRVICATAQVLVNDTNAGNGIVDCRGEVTLKLLCCHENAENEMPFAILRKIPFSQSVPTDGVEAGAETTASGVCNDIRITVDENRIVCEVNVRLQTKAQSNENFTYTKDVYSVNSPCETGYRKVPVSKSMLCFNGNFSMNEQLPIDSIGIRKGMRVVDLSGVAIPGTMEGDRGKTYINGRCRFHAILAGDNDYAAQEFEVPFRYEVSGNRELPTESDISTGCISCRGRIDGDKMLVDAEIAVSAALRKEEKITMLSDANFEGEWKNSNAAYRVCYPMQGDTLWSVAKRYHLPVRELAERNRIPETVAPDQANSLKDSKWLFV